VPKGYLRLLVFNADSALVGQQVQQLSSAALNNYQRLRVLVPGDGYVTAYVGNESDADVYFDDVTVELRQGLQVQETQYDPTGLELAGLSGTTPGLKSLSQYKFNGKEFQADLGLNWNHQDWRFFDTQLGRWHVTDPEIENGQESWTPYSFGFDNAVRFADADGRCPGGCPDAGTLQTAWQQGVNAGEAVGLPQFAIPVAIGVTVGAIVYSLWDHLPSLPAFDPALVQTASVGPATNYYLPQEMRGYPSNAPTPSALKDAKGRVEARKRPVTEKKAENLERNKDVPKTQLGPSGKPKINIVNKPTMKRARDAALETIRNRIQHLSNI